MKKIGLSQRTDFIESYGETRDCLDQKWAELLQSLGYIAVILPNNIVEPQSYLKALDLDGFILTGGNDDDRRVRLENAILDYAIERHNPVLGVCHGAQQIQRYFGGMISGLNSDLHVAKRHDIRTLARFSAYQAEQLYEVNSYHDYGIERGQLATGLKPLAIMVDDQSVEAFCHDEHNIWAIMWHPEREIPFRAEDKALIKTILN